jgi:energy-coupling factor transport system permease protein
MISGALSEVEERSMALEARGFSAPVGRTTLRVLPDSGAQFAARWAMLAGTIVLVVASLTGLVHLP